MQTKFFSPTGIALGTISWSKASLILIAVVSFWHMFAVRLNGDNWKNIIASDGAGYYAYLPATFIYQDLTYQFAEQDSKTYQSYPGCDIHFFGNRNAEGKRINKYFVGTAILETPFFLLAYFLSSVFDYPPGGYSFLFQAFICFAAVFYLLAGLHFLRLLLLKMKLKDTTVMIVLLLLFFGTNLYYYALEEPSMSHIYSFSALSFFLYNIFHICQIYSRKRLILISITLALIILIRPTNAIILLLIPFFLTQKNGKDLFKNVISDKKGIFTAGILFILLLFLQSILWKLTSGHWLVDSYVGESLSFTNPHISDVLFSWRKGLFIYTPVLLFSVAGVFFIRPFSKGIILFTFLLVNLYIISSWHDWSYGGSFGMRPFVDSYPVFAISLGFLIDWMRPIFIKIAIGIAFSFFVFLNLFQIYQYHNAILPFEFMTWNKYKRIFLHEEKVFAGIFDPWSDQVGNLPRNSRLIKSFIRNFENENYLNNAGVECGKKFYSAPCAAHLDEKTKNCGDLFFPIANVIPDSTTKKILIRVEAKIWLEEDGTDAKMVIAFKDDKNSYEWNGFFLVHRVWETKKWMDYSIVIPMPQIHSKSELISAYVIKSDDKEVYVDDLKITFYSQDE